MMKKTSGELPGCFLPHGDLQNMLIREHFSGVAALAISRLLIYNYLSKEGDLMDVEVNYKNKKRYNTANTLCGSGNSGHG
jgi:hypothetical protein